MTSEGHLYPTITVSGPSRSLKKEWVPPAGGGMGPTSSAAAHMEEPLRGRIAATATTPSRATIVIEAPPAHRQPSKAEPRWYEETVVVHDAPRADAALEQKALDATTALASPDVVAIAGDIHSVATPQRTMATTWVAASASRAHTMQTPSRRSVHACDDDLITEGPAKPLLKSWSTQLPDTAVPLINVGALETLRERRRRHPDAPLLNTRSRFMRDLGLTEADTIDPESGKSFLTLDDARRAYFGHPEEAAWVAFFSNVGRPIEDYTWLKAQVFVDDETAHVVHPHLLEDMGAAASSTASVGRTAGPSSHYASHLAAAWHVLTPNKQHDKSARDALIETFRLSQSAKCAASPPSSPSPLRGHDSSSGRVVALFQKEEGEGELPQPQWLVDLRTPHERAQRSGVDVIPASAPSTTAAEDVGGIVESPVGSFRRNLGPRQSASNSSTVKDGTFDRVDVVQAPHSSSVSIPITDRYRSATTPLVATMPSIRSGREYRNQMRRTFLDRKEKGIASAPPNVLNPRKPVDELIGPAAHAILYGSSD